MEETRYGIKIRLDHSDWLWITEGRELVPLLFDNREEAESVAGGWRIDGKEDNVRVLEYDRQ